MNLDHPTILVAKLRATKIITQAVIGNIITPTLIDLTLDRLLLELELARNVEDIKELQDSVKGDTSPVYAHDHLGLTEAEAYIQEQKSDEERGN